MDLIVPINAVPTVCGATVRRRRMDLTQSPSTQWFADITFLFAHLVLHQSEESDLPPQPQESRILHQSEGGYIP